MKIRTLGVLSALFLTFATFSVQAANKDMSDEDHKLNAECVGCHINATPGIVKQHLDSPMANASKHDDAVKCIDCHGESHVTEEDYAKAEMPTIETCKECHKKQVRQFRKGKHNLAWFGMKSQIAWHGQPGAIVDEGYKGCSGCHKLGEKGLLGIAEGNPGKLKHDKGEEASKYRYGNAQCDACHTRHAFQQDEAGDPRACSNCHMGFDHPQWEMFMSSKHGIIWDIEGNTSDGSQRAPTCQKCHMVEGTHDVATPWGFLALRIWVARSGSPRGGVSS